MRFVAYGLMAFAFFLVYTALQQSAPPGSGGSWGVIVAACVIGGIGALLKVSIQEGEQEIADENARETFERQEETAFEATALYLRPFNLSGKFEKSRVSAGIMDDITWKGAETLETYLAEACSGTLNFIGLGGRGGAQYGMAAAGEVEAWQDKILTAMTSAAYIFLIPSDRPGTLWEIGQIRSAHLHKTVFIMPPSMGSFQYTGKEPLGEVWTEAVAACREAYGLELPEYDPRGLLFRFDPKTQARTDVAFPHKNAKALTCAINQLFDKTAADTEPAWTAA